MTGGVETVEDGLARLPLDLERLCPQLDMGGPAIGHAGAGE